VSENVFEYDYGVVHDHTDGKAQTRQTDNIDVAAEQGHHEKCPDDTDGDGNGNDDRACDAAQEKNQNRNRQKTTYDDIFSDQVDGAVDIAGFIINLDDLNFSVLQYAPVQFFQNGLQTIHDRQHIGAGLPDGIHDQGGRAQIAHDHIQVLEVQTDLGNIPDGYRNTVHTFDDDIGDVIGVLVFPHGPGHVFPFAFIEISGADVFVFYIQRTDQFRNGHPA